MKKLFAVAAIAGLLGSTAAFADAGADLAKAKNCLACHAVDKKLVGPPTRTSPPSTRATRPPKPS
jgi:cytochrome c